VGGQPIPRTFARKAENPENSSIQGEGKAEEQEQSIRMRGSSWGHPRGKGGEVILKKGSPIQGVKVERGTDLTT